MGEEVGGSSPSERVREEKLYVIARGDLPVGLRTAQVGHALMQSKGLGIDNLSLLNMEGSGQVFQGSFTQSQRLWEYLFSEKACTHEQGQDDNLFVMATFQGFMHWGVMFVKATSDLTKKCFFP